MKVGQGECNGSYEEGLGFCRGEFCGSCGVWASGMLLPLRFGTG
jgi:hypothetical protein